MLILGRTCVTEQDRDPTVKMRAGPVAEGDTRSHPVARILLVLKAELWKATP